MNVTLLNTTSIGFWNCLPDRYSDWTKSPSFACITTFVVAALMISWRMSQKDEKAIVKDRIPRSPMSVGRKVKVKVKKGGTESLETLKNKCLEPFQKYLEFCELIENFKWQQINQNIDQFEKINFPLTERSLWKLQDNIRKNPSLDHSKVFFGLRFFYVLYYLKRKSSKKAYYHFFLYSLLYAHLRSKSPAEFFLTASIPDRIRKARNFLCEKLQKIPMDPLQKKACENWIQTFNKRWDKNEAFDTFFNPDKNLEKNLEGNSI